ncbi:HERC2, partial [Symbiodinium microadriaticum]
MWSADFVIQTGGWVYVWNDAGPPEFHCEHHWIDDGSIWTAMCRQFRKPCDLPRNRAWVPVPCLNDGGCHFVRATDPGEARVLMHDPSGVPGDEATECRLLLDTDGPRRVPLGWRLRPDVEQREQNGGFRDGDVFVPTRSGASPSLLGLLVGARLPVGLRLFLFGFCICSWSTAMVAPSLEQQTILPTPVGKYPWRVPYDIRAMHEAVLPGTRAAPLSPFSPHDEPCELTPDTLADDIYVSLSSHEPVWYHEVAPVWPALGIHRLTFVPVPPCPELVCVVVVSADWQLPVLIPKRADINWVLSHVRRHTPGAVVALRGPVGASARHRSDSDAVDWRNGDVLLAIEWHAAGRSLEVPTFLSLEHVRHSGLWMMDFQTACVVQLIIWRPGRPPVTTDMPADASWDATRQCFRGRFETKYPGAWAPVPWAYSNAVNLCQRSQDPTLCNVLVEVVSLVGQDYQLEPTCHTVHQASSRHSIAGALQLPTTDLRLIGIAEPSDDFPALRDGDVIHYRSPLDSRSRPFGNRVVLAGLLSYRLRPVLAPALFFLVGLSHVASASPSPGYDDHWLWSPYQGRLGPVHLQDGSAPDAAFTALEPIWSRGFIQVVPRPEHRRVWVPRPLSSTLVSVLLFGPPSAVAQMLPPVLSRALLLRIMRHFFGEVLAVAGRRFGLRSLEPAERLVPLNDGDLLVAIMETWVPSIQFGWPTQFQSIAAARERGLWSHALTFQGRGWAFLWYDGRTQPVTVPLRGMQTWDPSVCVLRPAFNHLTEGWWPRLHHRESCDSHIHFVPAHSLEAQGCRHRLSDADVSADTASAPAVLEFRDQHSRVPSGRRPNSFLATWQAVQARCSTHFRHVHSHVGILVNTFADALADHASRATHTAPAMFQPLDALRTLIEREGPWTWLIPRAVLRNGVPVYQVQVDTALELPREEPAEDIPQDSSAPAPTPVMPLHVITANVQSLKDAACNPFNPSGHAARRQYFYDQLHRHEVDIVCLQETRSKAGRWATAGVLTWRSGALKGQYGCEVWIRPEIVRPALTLLDFRIVVSQPRLLLVTSINPRFPVSVCTAHAPHSDRPDSEAETFWRELREALNRAPISRGLVVGLDANGDFTSADFAGPWAHSLASQALDFDLATANRKSCPKGDNVGAPRSRTLSGPLDEAPNAEQFTRQVEAAARSQAGGKAPGPDQVPNEIWSRHPVYTGQWLWPLCLSIGLSGREPFHFKRAIVCALYKKGPASLPENYRSIALLNGIAKLWHGHLRRSIGGSILGRYDPLQLGGRSGVPVSFAVAACRAASDLYSVQGRCEATLYVDIQAAYYEASRALLFHGDSQLSAPPEQHLQHLASLTQLLVSEGALQILGVAPEEIALLQDCVSASHWSLSGSTNIYLATRGSRYLGVVLTPKDTGHRAARFLSRWGTAQIACCDLWKDVALLFCPANMLSLLTSTGNIQSEEEAGPKSIPLLFRGEAEEKTVFVNLSLPQVCENETCSVCMETFRKKPPSVLMKGS